MAIRIEDLSRHQATPARPVLRVVELSPRARSGRATYARRRLLFVVAVAAVAAVVGVVAAGARTAAPVSTAPLQPAVTGVTDGAAAPVVVLGPGETLWTALAPYTPAGTTRAEWVHDVLSLNDIDARGLGAGAVVRLPAR